MKQGHATHPPVAQHVLVDDGVVDALSVNRHKLVDGNRLATYHNEVSTSLGGGNPV